MLVCGNLAALDLGLYIIVACRVTFIELQRQVGT